MNKIIVILSTVALFAAACAAAEASNEKCGALKNQFTANSQRLTQLFQEWDAGLRQSNDVLHYYNVPVSMKSLDILYEQHNLLAQSLEAK